MRNPIEILKWLLEDLRRSFPDVMFSPRTHCVPHTAPATGFKSADLVLYAHNFTDLEVRVHLQESGAYELTVGDDDLSQNCKEFIVGYFEGLDDADVAIALQEAGLVKLEMPHSNTATPNLTAIFKDKA